MGSDDRCTPVIRKIKNEPKNNLDLSHFELLLNYEFKNQKYHF
jgi:hypothetical protein